ncbi:50S ribosomal protein L30 [Kitasatospora sp. NPDC127111]|uniref:50S ribosomal protein L30 n=1 Tax=Kitasatospora sp. NPDC127111 TaxID=3345363 RepID=UPI00363ECC36
MAGEPSSGGGGASSGATSRLDKPPKDGETRQNIQVKVGHKAKVIQIRPPRSEHQKRVLRALGLRRVGAVRFVEGDRPSIRGMLQAVDHLIEVSFDQGAQIEESFCRVSRWLPEIEVQSTIGEYRSGEYIKVLRGKQSASVIWSTELSLHRLLASMGTVEPHWLTRSDSLGRSTWNRYGQLHTQPAIDTWRRVRTRNSNPSFVRFESEGISLVWISPKFNDRNYGQLSATSRDGNLLQFLDLISQTATFSIARSLHTIDIVTLKASP